MPNKTLVLAEKPSVAREIARVLGCRQSGPGCLMGGSYIVTWALGHLVTLADPETYGETYKQWRLEDLPMLPKNMQLVVIKETGKQFSAVSALLRRADVGDVVIATDAGREGELVARWILQKAGCKKPLRRLWISSQTDRAIRDGFANLRPGREYENLFHAARARAEADWLVGLNITRALTCKHGAQLSAGRVQTPTLTLICRREEEILRFHPKEYFTVRAQFEGFDALYQDKQKQSRFFEPAAAEAVAKACEGKGATVAELKREYKHQAPPAAYDLTELQRDANKTYGLSAKQTLDATQRLYEIHKIVTYPRTDSRYIPEDVVPTLPERLRAIAFGSYAETARALLRQKLSTRYLVNNAKVTDHHAILPTEEHPDVVRLSRAEAQVYDLIVRRFLAVLSAPHEYDDVRVRLQIGQHSFFARGKSVRQPGWKAVYGNWDDDGDRAEEETQSLPALRQGQSLRANALRLQSGKTKPPARYTEATLLSAMEHPVEEAGIRRQETGGEQEIGIREQGIGETGRTPLTPNPSALPPSLGTPATRADIIEKLFDSFYMERRGKEIVPTSKGRQLVKIAPPSLTSAALTAQWEQRLANIANGRERAETFLEEMRRYAAALVSEAIASDAKYVHDNATREICPDCGKFLLDVTGKKGRMLVCPDRDCGYRKNVSMITNARCPECHKKLELRGEGDKKSFYCTCGYREKASAFEERKQSAGANKRETQRFLESQKDEARTTLGDLFQGLEL
ncbi:MAG: DNA topoisomerase III [Oscillospiraceae bacterium]|jgi:DNA topoisomerase-3|nr:DNA topoisomerase III [Oscillospiraceae bacterium]